MAGWKLKPAQPIPVHSKSPSGREHSRSEYLFLLQCLRRALSVSGENLQQARGRLCVPASGVSWSHFLRLAEHHQVLPLVQVALRDLGQQVPASIRDWLNQRCRTIAAHNLSLAAELIDLLECLHRINITALPFKGPALAAALYKSLAERQVSDLDVLVDPSRIQDAVRVLESRGYLLEERFRHMPVEYLFANHKDLHLIHPVTGIHLDLHWTVSEPTFDERLSTMRIPRGISTVSLLHREVSIPAPEDLLLLLSVHGLRHRWEKLKWICDLACLFRTYPDFDWALALEKAKDVSRERMILLGVMLVRELSDVRLPSKILDLIEREETLPGLARQVYSWQRSEEESVVRLSLEAVREKTSFDAFRLRSRENLLDRFELLCRLFADKMKPNAADKEYFLMPPLVTPLYWLIRPIRVLLVYGPRCMFRSARELIGAL